MAYRDPNVGRARGRERFRRRTAGRIARGACTRCGKEPPAQGRRLCEPCAAKKNSASRARDAKLRAEGRPRRDPEREKSYRREHRRRQVAERIARGLCPRCGKEPPAPERSLCAPCGEKRRAADRARYKKAKSQGKLYGGADPKTKRRTARRRSRERLLARRDAGVCTRCGKNTPAEGRTACTPCRDARQAAEREMYAVRRAARLCVRCGGPTTDGGSRCAPCAVLEEERRPPERKNAASRKRYAERRARDACTDCGAPALGAARCEPCARRSYERSAHFRGLPLYPPQYTVIELATGTDHGTWDSWEEVAMCLAFARLSLDQVEVLIDQSPMQTLTD